MNRRPEGNAIIYCEGAFNTPNGKTTHGLVRFTNRYRLLSVVDSRYAGMDAANVLDGKPKNIPIYASIGEALQQSHQAGQPATHLVVGLAPDGGRLSAEARLDVKKAIEQGLNVDCGLHDFLSEDPEMVELAAQHHAKIRALKIHFRM